MTATIPRCARPGCGRRGPLYGGLCHRCLAIEEREDAATDEARETAREARKGWRRERWR